MFALSFLIAVSVGLVVAVQEFNKRQSIVDLIHANNENFLQIISIHARAYNYSIIEILSQNQLQRDEINYVQVTDDIGFAVFDSKPELVASDKLEAVIEFKKPLILEDKSFSERGQVLLGYELPSLSNVVIDAFKNALLVYLIVFTSTLFVLTYYINKFVSIPIQHFTNSIRESRRTKTHVTAELGDDTELGRLAQEYNVMQTELNKYRQDFDRSRKLKMLGTVVGGVAHEFNNILAVILSSLDMIKLESTKSKNMSSRLSLIESAANNATNIISKLLATKNINSQEPEISELGNILDNINNLATSFYDPERISLEIDCNETFYVRCHESEFSSAIINLIKNSSQAINESTGKITVSCHSPDESERKHHMAPKGDFCVLTVIDNGPGIAQELQEHLFEPFFTTKSQSQGTGLGLWCLYELIISMEGFVYYTDAKPSGAIFTMFLPTLPFAQARAANNPERSYTEVSLSGITLLIVEDEKNLIEIFQQFFTAKGAIVYSAYTRKDALSLIRENKFDAIVCDLHLTDGDGFDVCRLSKSENILTILISGNPIYINKLEFN